MKTVYYVIDGLNDEFKTLSDVRLHIYLFNDIDRKNMDCTPIYGFDKEGNETKVRWYHYRNSGKIVLSKN